ncbi:MAG: phosphotransferase [Mediterranea sp.]|nr:phosphotransferase [Mediterranea sp.]
MNDEQLKELYREATGSPSDNMVELPGAGSNRRYYRLTGTRPMIGVIGTSTPENEAFLYMAAHFRQAGLPVPEVYAVSADKSRYLQEDLGDTSLFQAIANGRATGNFDEEEKRLLRRAIRLLPTLQFEGAKGFDYTRCYPRSTFDRRSVYWDLNYFKYCFLKATGLEFSEERLEDDFDQMAYVMACMPKQTFMYRDFQSRNVMIRDGEPWLIDFQGGREGPPHYDVASFLWQAKANFPETLRQELLNEYIDSLRQYQPVDDERFREQLRHFVLLRTLQVLGAYGFRGYFEKKTHFVESVPYAMANLRGLLREGIPAYPYLAELLERLANDERFAIKQKSATTSLTVDIKSFAYKNGIPDDASGNGGGFVFDCRAIHNPGRYERYQSLTGNDEPVARFLEEGREMFAFLKHAYALVDPSVERYLKRGFTHLAVNFGCTGGQHRSVYAARRLAEHLSRKYGVRVVLEHRELGIKEMMDEKQ